MGKINYQKIYTTNKDEWKALTREPQKYEALLAGHYSESNHFVYELLQNAEDEKADRVVIEYYDDKLVFYHNGIPFDENDVRGVSSMALGKGAYAIHQSGKWYTNDNIDQMLMERHLNKKARRSSRKCHIKGPKKRTEEDDERFIQSFEKMLLMAREKEGR